MRRWLALLPCLLPSWSAAQDVRDADTLPKNVGALILQPGINWNSGVERFGHGWKTGRESLLTDVNDIDLSGVLNLGAIQLGRTLFTASQRSVAFQIAAAFGVTDRLTVAAFLPYQRSSYTLDFAIVPGENQAHLAVINPQEIKCDEGGFDLDVTRITEDRGAAYQFNAADVRTLLVSDCLDYKDPIDRYEVDANRVVHGIGERSYSGFRDLILGAKYKLFHGRAVQLSAITYVIAPTGKVEDPRDLFDFNFGDGQWDAALLGAITVPLGDFRLAGSAGWEVSFGDSLERRLTTVSFSDELEARLARGEISEEQLLRDHLDEATVNPIATKYDLALVDRKLGDTFYVYSGFGYQALEWLSLGVTLDFFHHFRDSLGAIGPRFGGAAPYKTEQEIRAEVDQLVAMGTITEAQKTDELVARLRASRGRYLAAYGWHTVRGQVVAGLSIGINTLGPFLRDEFPLPLIANLSISRFLAGQNLDTPDQIALSLIVPIPVGDIKDPAEYGFDDEGQGLPWP